MRNDIPTYRFADIIYDLGMFYNYAYLMIERNSYGIDILQRLHKEKQYAIVKTKRKDAITGKRKFSHGWYNDNVSKTILVNDLKESFETGLILINDTDTLEQMKIYQESKGSFGNTRARVTMMTLWMLWLWRCSIKTGQILRLGFTMTNNKKNYKQNRGFKEKPRKPLTPDERFNLMLERFLKDSKENLKDISKRETNKVGGR